MIKKEAERRGLQVEEYLLALLDRFLNSKEKIEAYIKLHEKYLREAEELYAKDELTQACEKYWGAVTTLLNAIGEKKGLPHYSHRDLAEIVECLVEEANNPKIAEYFAQAERLHANYYHNFLRKITFDHHRRNVMELIAILKRYLQSSQDGKQDQASGEVHHC